MPKQYVVKQGDYLSAIADKFGFHSYTKIWDDPANADLKKKRGNPSVLMVGDVLTIPDKESRDESRPTGATHDFVVPNEKLMLRLVTKNESGDAVANTSCQLIVEGTPQDLTTDGDGKIEKQIPETSRNGQFIIASDDPPISLNVPVGIGELDPIDEVTGQIGRLNNLGYDAGKVEDPADDDAKLQFRSAVEEYQCNNKLKVDGVCGPQTQGSLKKVHGC